MPLPVDADVVVVRGYWWDEATGAGVKVGNGPTVITFDPVHVLGAKVGGTPNVRDVTSTGYVKTRRRSATVDPVTGYFATIVLSSNDPDLDPYGGRRVTFPGERSFLIEVPYNAPVVVVDAAMSSAIGLPIGTPVKAIWLTDASLLENPIPGAPQGYLTSAQVFAAIANSVHDHDVSSTSHQSLRDLVTTNAIEAATALSTHVNSPEPHPEYDDIPSLTLLFQNGLV